MLLSRRTAALALAVVIVAGSSAFAQGRHGPPVGRGRTPRVNQPRGEPHGRSPLEQFSTMSPEQRQRELAKLPPDKREKLEKQLQRYGQLTPSQKESLERFNSLPPERQEAFRKAFAKFQKEPPERQEAMREELNRLRAMSEEERAARLQTPEFRSKFGKSEQQMLHELSSVFLD